MNLHETDACSRAWRGRRQKQERCRVASREDVQIEHIPSFAISTSRRSVYDHLRDSCRKLTMSGDVLLLRLRTAAKVRTAPACVSLRAISWSARADTRRAVAMRRARWASGAAFMGVARGTRGQRRAHSNVVASMWAALLRKARTDASPLRELRPFPRPASIQRKRVRRKWVRRQEPRRARGALGPGTERDRRALEHLRRE